jgi:hypothetical protein
MVSCVTHGKVLSNNIVEDLRTIFISAEVVASITSWLGDGDRDVRNAAVDVICKLIEYGTFDFSRKILKRLTL